MSTEDDREFKVMALDTRRHLRWRSKAGTDTARSCLKAVALTLVTSLAALTTAGPSAAQTDLLPTMRGFFAHRGIYELKLADQKEGSNISKIDGRLVYEFTGNTCSGFSTQFRFMTRIESEDGDIKISDMRTTSYEDGPGNSFDFVNQTYISSVLTEDSKGKAARTADTIDIALSKPKADTLTIAGDALFPTQHLARLIAAARAGEKVVEIKLYDGSDGGNKIELTTSVIGKELPADEISGDESVANGPELVGIRHWPIKISYFDASKPIANGEAVPDYQLSFVLYENGVSRHMKLDYGDFSLEGRLVDLKPIPSGKCE